MKRGRVVLFDLGNVLVRIHPEAFADTLGVPATESGNFRPLVIATTQRYERGELTSEEFFSNLGGIFGGRYDRPKLKEAMRNVIGKPIPGMPELLEKTASSGDVALVSNTNEEHFDYCRRNFAFLSLFPRYFLSWKRRVLKPDAEYYAHVLRQLNIPANHALFIDDLPENIEGAVKAGMVGILFDGAESLSETLERLGVI